CLLPERAPRSRGPSDSTFRAMSHFPHFSSAAAEYFSPARERWLEISHDRVLQGRHNHLLWLRFRVFFAKASSRGAAGVPHFSPLLRAVGDRPPASHPRQASQTDPAGYGPRPSQPRPCTPGSHIVAHAPLPDPSN